LEERSAASPVSQSQHLEADARTDSRAESRPEIRTESQRLRACLQPVHLPPRVELCEFTDANFGDEVVSAKVPVIIDFWSETCGPCKLMHPVVRRLAETFGARAKVGRLNVFANPRTTEALEIKAIPYIMVVHHGDVVFELVGDRTFDDLHAKLTPFIP
jgi:thioredoxin 1